MVSTRSLQSHNTGRQDRPSPNKLCLKELWPRCPDTWAIVPRRQRGTTRQGWRGLNHSLQLEVSSKKHHITYQHGTWYTNLHMHRNTKFKDHWSRLLVRINVAECTAVNRESCWKVCTLVDGHSFSDDEMASLIYKKSPKSNKPGLDTKRVAFLEGKMAIAHEIYL